jgi:hypothetical protein
MEFKNNKIDDSYLIIFYHNIIFSLRKILIFIIKNLKNKKGKILITDSMEKNEKIYVQILMKKNFVINL